MYQLLGIHHLCPPPPPQFVLGLISEGSRLPFVRFPDKCHLRNNRSAVRHPQFDEEAISKLFLNDCIQEHCEPPYCVNHLSVAEGKKLRLVIDLRLRFTEWPVCSMCLLRLPGGMVCVSCGTHASFERGPSCIPRVST